MRFSRQLVPAFLITLVSTACATTSRMPLADVPPGTYVMVEPASEEFNAVALNEGAWALRMGNETMTGVHWVDSDGRLHITEDSGACAGQESIWTYTYTNNRITMQLVEDMCATRDPALPERMVYERQ